MNVARQDTSRPRLRRRAGAVTAFAATLAVLVGAPAIVQPPGSAPPPSASGAATVQTTPAQPVTDQTGRTGVAAAAPGQSWVGTWGASLHRSGSPDFQDVTLRLVVRTSTAGSALRLRFANTYGEQPLRLGTVRVGLQQRGPALVPGSNRPVTFGGKPSVTIPEGGQVISDRVQLAVPALSTLAVSMYLPEKTAASTEHLNSNRTSFVSTTGDHSAATGAQRFATETRHWSFLQGVDVWRPRGGTLVTLGDSITAGAEVTYPEVLANRLQRDPRLRGVGVLNEGIGAGELLRRAALYGLSDPMLSRMDRDVLLQSGVRAVLVLAGTNDILGSHRASADQVIAGYQQLLTRARDRGVRVLGATITPCSCYDATREQTRERVNRWIRDVGSFDGVVDFDRALRDPADRHRMNPALHDPADPLHPNAAGYRAMANSVPLQLLAG